MVSKKCDILSIITQKIDTRIFGNSFSFLLSRLTDAINEINLELELFISKPNEIKDKTGSFTSLENTLNMIATDYNIPKSVENFIKFNVIDSQNFVLFYESGLAILVDEVDLKIIINRIIKIKASLNEIYNKLKTHKIKDSRIIALLNVNFSLTIEKLNAFISYKITVLNSIPPYTDTSEKFIFDLTEIDLNIFQRSLEKLSKITKSIEENIGSKNDFTFTSTLCSYLKNHKKSYEEISREIGINKSYISRLVNGERRNPARDIVLKLCIVLELGLNDTYSLLSSAGYTLEDNNKRDFIIKTFMENSVYSIDKIDEILSDYEQKYLFHDTGLE